MTLFLIANIAPLMFGMLVVVLLLGYPVAFSLAGRVYRTDVGDSNGHRAKILGHGEPAL